MTISSSDSPSLLGPWLAAGLGLAALAAMPTTEPSNPVGALEPVPTVRASNADTANVLARLGLTSIQPPPTPSALDPGLQHLLTARHDEQAEKVNDLSTPARIDRMFAVNGSPVRPTTPPPRPTPPVASPSDANSPSADEWSALRWCESRGDYTAVNPSGKYRGAYQFDQATWETVGGTGDPAAAPAAEQDARAAALYEQRGAAPWPYCGKYLG